MAHPAPHTLQGEVFTVQPYRGERGRDPGVGRAFVLEVVDEAASGTLMASLPMIDRLLAEKVTAVRQQRLGELVDFMAARMLAPSAVDLDMAQRLARRHAGVLNEFGYFAAEQLADMNGSEATNRSALADNWRKRRQVFAVPHPDKAARERDVYPAFQFDNGKPLKVVQQVLDAFGGRKAAWKLALWFTSNHGGLPGSARPVDLLNTAPDEVVRVAQLDAMESAA